MPALGTMGRLEDRAAPARARATPASGKTSVISTSLRRGAASEAAPTAVTSDDRGRHRDQLPPAAAQRRAPPSPASPSSTISDLDDPAGGAAHRFADPAAPHPPDLARGHRRVADRVLAEVLGEVFLADLAERRVARQVGVAVGDAVEERRRVDLVERLRARLEVAAQVALDQQRLDPLVLAVGGEEGADVERLAAAGGDRHDAVEDDCVADRPGDDRQQQRARASSAAAGEPGSPARARADAGSRRGRRRRRPTSRYSGRISAVRPKRKPGAAQPSSRRSGAPGARSPRGRRAPPRAG